MAVPELKMNTGASIPQIGLGLWLNKDEKECKDAVKWALEAGYTHFDSAQAYKNEQFLGAAIKESGIKREKVFITTKIQTENMGLELMDSFDESMKKLDMDYVDLLLLHFPVTIQRRPAWHNMEDIFNSGRAKAIGVSNYTIRHLEELLRESKIKPAVNQVELHIFLQQPELLEYCRKNNVVVEAYSPLAHGRRWTENPVLAGIAKRHGKSIAQIMIRWCIDVGTVPLPKSTHKERIQENLDIFDFKLDEQEMSELARLDEDFRTCWDPTNVS